MDSETNNCASSPIPDDCSIDSKATTLLHHEDEEENWDDDLPDCPAAAPRILTPPPVEPTTCISLRDHNLQAWSPSSKDGGRLSDPHCAISLKGVHEDHGKVLEYSNDDYVRYQDWHPEDIWRLLMRYRWACLCLPDPGDEHQHYHPAATYSSKLTTYPCNSCMKFKAWERFSLLGQAIREKFVSVANIRPKVRHILDFFKNSLKHVVSEYDVSKDLLHSVNLVKTRQSTTEENTSFTE